MPYDMLADYQNYDPAFQAMNSSRPPAAPQAAGGASAALPWVGAGLSAAGLLSSLYGGYKAQESADRNYEEQMREYQKQQAIEEDNRKRQIAQQALENQYGAKKSVDEDAQNRLARYANYYRAIGV